MSFINVIIIACSLAAIVVAFVIILCLCDCYMTPNQAAHIIFTYDIILDQVYQLSDSIFDGLFCCCRTIDRRIIPRDEPIPIREIELPQMVLINNPCGQVELGAPCKTE